jgi:hypothetical protein
VNTAANQKANAKAEEERKRIEGDSGEGGEVTLDVEAEEGAIVAEASVKRLTRTDTRNWAKDGQVRVNEK